VLAKDVCYKCYYKMFREWFDASIPDDIIAAFYRQWESGSVTFCQAAGFHSFYTDTGPPDNCPHLFEQAVANTMTANVCSNGRDEGAK
jgi:hypothetical protein